TQEQGHGRQNSQVRDTSLRIGLIGLGTVGSQVADRLLNWREQLRRRASGVELALVRVLVRDLEKERAVAVPAGLLTRDPAAVLDDPDIDVVVELAGGGEPGRSFLERGLRDRKRVETGKK